MLNELRIDNFAIIDHLELSFLPGLNILTGETGAGKSIIIDAVLMLLGARADSAWIRTGVERAEVEGVFELPAGIREGVLAILEREQLLDDPNTVSLGRELRRNGRSVARVNGRSVNVGLLVEIGEHLIDVHGQSEHLSLLHVRNHLGLLDRYAVVGELLAGYSASYHRLVSTRHALAELRQAESEAARRIDILTYQINEIDAAHLRAVEEEELRDERNRLANAEGLASLAQEAIQLLDEGTPDSPAVSDLFGGAVSAVNGLIRLDDSKQALADQAELLAENLLDLVVDLRSYLESIEFNPRRLDQVEERLNLIHNLKRKYGADITAVLAFAEGARQQLDAITHAGERITELEEEETRLLKLLGTQGQALSIERRARAKKMEKALEAELQALNMSGARFKVDFRQRPDPLGVPLDDGQRVAFDASGIERVEFLVAINPGEGLKPLAKTASGGETSRLMLAIKNVLAQADQVPTLIFDEIDQGIGGRVGGVVGRKLWQLARQHQVLCITHLPQLAVYGEQHLCVNKQIDQGRTLARVQVLQGQARLEELAQMLGEVSQGTLHSAKELLEGVDPYQVSAG
jgi:DNA repair protein RecN (Recombination protein N)